MTPASIRLLIPLPDAPGAKTIAQGAWDSGLDVYMNIRAYRYDLITWADLARMTIRIPTDVKLNIVHVTLVEHFDLYTVGMKNLFILTDPSLCPPVKPNVVWNVTVCDVDQPVSGDLFRSWVEFAS